MKYKFFPHTADAEFEAYGKNIEEAFANAAEAMISVMTDPTKIKPTIKKQIKIEAQDKESLLFDFLTEFLIWLDADNVIGKGITKIKITENKLEAELVGDKFSDKYETLTMVKAVTYNNMKITETKNKVTVRVVVDV